jgi:hypothetical protein
MRALVPSLRFHASLWRGKPLYNNPIKTTVPCAVASTRRRAYLAAKAVNLEPRGDVNLQQELLVCHVSPASFQGREH